jgi:predicted RecA/RadA family phage recombinase
MAKNYIQEGKTIDYTASGADVLSGALVVIGTIAGIAKTTIPNGKTGAVHIKGIFSVPKATGAIIQGAKLYWSTVTNNLSTTATGNTLVGVASEAAVSGDTTVKILLNVGL